MRMKIKRLPRHLKPSQIEVDEAYKIRGHVTYERALERAELRRRGRKMKSPSKRTIFI